MFGDNARGWQRFLPRVLLLLGAIVPNLPALVGGFVYDDFAVIASDERFHSLTRLGSLWTTSYWPDPGVPLYRPLSGMLWSFLWSIGGGEAWVFHLASILVAGAVVLMFHAVLVRAGVGGEAAFAAAALFALFPIHTEVTATGVGLSELCAAAFGLGALLLLQRRRLVGGLLLFGAGVLTKESIAVLPLAAPIVLRSQVIKREQRLRWAGAFLASCLVVGAVLVARKLVAVGPTTVSFLDNPLFHVPIGQRLLTALWIQILYLGKTLAPLTLSADYSFNQIPIVTSLSDPRAWAGLALLPAGAAAAWFFPALRAGLALWTVLFLPTANVLFPIGTIMAERLAFAPSAGLALALAAVLVKAPRWRAVLVAVALVFGARTWARNLDWLSADSFYPKMTATAPRSAKAYSNFGTYLASRGRDEEAVAAYDRSIAIFPGNPEPWHNRGNALARLGRWELAKRSYRECLRLMPGSTGTRENLEALERGVPLHPAPARY